MNARLLVAAVAFSAALASLLPAAAASNPVASGPFEGCPAHGAGGDPQLNRLKNRNASPESASPITVAGMKQLPRLPAGTPAMRADWPASARATVDSHEGQGVVFTGYILRVSHETGDASNCGSSLPSQEDVELFLAKRPGTTDGANIILAEVTPRWRAAYKAWRPANLRKVAADGNRVRITGWLLYDEEAWREIGSETATPWEIEPITTIEVLRNGSWTSY